MSALQHRHISTLILPADISWVMGPNRLGLRQSPASPRKRATSGCRSRAAVRRTNRHLHRGDATREPTDGCSPTGDTIRRPGDLRTFPRVWSAVPPTAGGTVCLSGGSGNGATRRGPEHRVGGRPIAGVVLRLPGKPSDLVPDGCQVVSMAGPVGAAEALVALADRLAPNAIAAAAELSRPEMPSGALNVLNAADVIGVLLPEHAIVVDESNTSGLMLPQATSGAPAHDWLTLTGGSIGYGLPVSVGRPSHVPTARCCAWGRTVRRCTRFRRSGRRLASS